MRCEPTVADDGAAAGSQRFVVGDQRTMPQIVTSVRLPSNAHTTTLRTAKQLQHAGSGARWRISVTSSSSSSPGIDTTVPSTARMYDYWLGGHDNFAADRAAALAVSEAAPEAQLMAVENRGFLRRAVRHLAADAGITQFLDIGTGLPTQGNVHQIAHVANPDARVVYVDNDPMVVAHSRALKAGDNTAVIEADLRDPQAILDDEGTRKLID